MESADSFYVIIIGFYLYKMQGGFLYSFFLIFFIGNANSFWEATVKVACTPVRLCG